MTTISKVINQARVLNAKTPLIIKLFAFAIILQIIYFITPFSFEINGESALLIILFLLIIAINDKNEYISTKEMEKKLMEFAPKYISFVPSEDKTDVSEQSSKQLETKQKKIVMKSKGEVAIGNWLESNKIEYNYEMPLDSMLPDFYIPNHLVVIEYWGLASAKGLNGLRYRYSMSKKMKRYKQLRLDLISIYPEDLDNLDELFEMLIHKQ